MLINEFHHLSQKEALKDFCSEIQKFLRQKEALKDFCSEIQKFNHRITIFLAFKNREIIRIVMQDSVSLVMKLASLTLRVYTFSLMFTQIFLSVFLYFHTAEARSCD